MIPVQAGEEINDPSVPGSLLSRQAIWSSDSRWFFYLRRDGAQVQLWETRYDGKETKQVTHSNADLVDLRASVDPEKIIVKLMPERRLLDQAENEEYRNGVLYDEHIIEGMSLTKTLPVIDRLRSLRTIDTGEWMPPGPTERPHTVFDIPMHRLMKPPAFMPDALTSDRLVRGSKVFQAVALSAIGPDIHYYPGQYGLQLTDLADNGKIRKCELAECMANRISILGESRNGDEVYYAADSLFGRLGAMLPGRTLLCAWNWRTNVVRRIYEPSGRLYDLEVPGDLKEEPGAIAGDEIILAFTAADQPPRLEAINLRGGTSRVLFDPNRELRAITQNRAQWISWSTPSGYPGRGIMVLPDDYHAGLRYPAVITTYACGNGFLRGGNADGPPEFMLARHGFIAICVDMPVREILLREPDHSRLHADMCDIILSLVSSQPISDLVDSKRIGLSGQSLGANFGTYCISHSKVFAAAAFRHGSIVERALYDLFNNWEPSLKNSYDGINMPDPKNDPMGRWADMSVSMRVAQIDTPTLIDNNDSEYLLALPFWSAMRNAKKPIEMYVFPDETHVLWQPIHQLINYDREVDWFRFWLKQEEDLDSIKRPQYERWERLRNSTSASTFMH